MQTNEYGKSLKRVLIIIIAYASHHNNGTTWDMVGTASRYGDGLGGWTSSIACGLRVPSISSSLLPAVAATPQCHRYCYRTGC